jgi:hypothetical protein
LLAAISGVCGGFALPLFAEPPQSTGTGQEGQAVSGGDITVTGQQPVRIGGTPARSPCPAANAAGKGADDCAAAKLDEAARVAQHAATIDPTLAVPNARSGDTTVGVGSLTGSSQRLGADLRGRTTLPVRPVPTPPASPFRR